MEGLYQSPPYSYLPQQQQQQQQQQHNNIDHVYRSNSYSHHQSMNNWSPPPHHNHAYHYYSSNNNQNAVVSPRPKITTNIWEDEGTLCFQVDAKGVCVARRQDNDMINGTKLLNVVGMSRGKRDGILKNEKGRVVVKVGAMHLKGVWIPFSRATELAEKFKILDVLYPLFVEEPSIYLCNPIGNGAHTDVIPSVTKCNMVSSPLPAFNNRPTSADEYTPPIPNWDARPYLTHYDHGLSRNPHHHHHHHHNHQHPSTSDENDMYLLNNSNTHNNQFNNHHNNRGSFSSVSSHPSYLYPSLHQEDDSKPCSVTTPTSYVDHMYNHTGYGSRSFNGDKYTTASSPYIKSSPYTNTAPAVVADHRSAGSTTPSSWFSPETPTAVLFAKEEVASKKRKTSTCSLDPSMQKASPDRVTRRIKTD